MIFILYYVFILLLLHLERLIHLRIGQYMLIIVINNLILLVTFNVTQHDTILYYINVQCN